MRLALLAVCLTGVAALPLAQRTPASQAPTTTSARTPNIILIHADDLGWGDLSSYGQQRYRTPNIDRLATEGTRFTQYYSGSTVCAPVARGADDRAAHRSRTHPRQRRDPARGCRPDDGRALPGARLSDGARRQVGTRLRRHAGPAREAGLRRDVRLSHRTSSPIASTPIGCGRTARGSRSRRHATSPATCSRPPPSTSSIAQPPAPSSCIWPIRCRTPNSARLTRRSRRSSVAFRRHRS